MGSSPSSRSRVKAAQRPRLYSIAFRVADHPGPDRAEGEPLPKLRPWALNAAAAVVGGRRHPVSVLALRARSHRARRSTASLPRRSRCDDLRRGHEVFGGREPCSRSRSRRDRRAPCSPSNLADELSRPGPEELAGMHTAAAVGKVVDDRLQLIVFAGAVAPEIRPVRFRGPALTSAPASHPHAALIG